MSHFNATVCAASGAQEAGKGLVDGGAQNVITPPMGRDQ
jgi:hypothetical protein